MSTATQNEAKKASPMMQSPTFDLPYGVCTKSSTETKKGDNGEYVSTQVQLAVFGATISLKCTEEQQKRFEEGQAYKVSGTISVSNYRVLLVPATIEQVS